MKKILLGLVLTSSIAHASTSEQEKLINSLTSEKLHSMMKHICIAGVATFDNVKLIEKKEEVCSCYADDMLSEFSLREFKWMMKNINLVPNRQARIDKIFKDCMNLSSPRYWY